MIKKVMTLQLNFSFGNQKIQIILPIKMIDKKSEFYFYKLKSSFSTEFYFLNQRFF